MTEFADIKHEIQDSDLLGKKDISLGFGLGLVDEFQRGIDTPLAMLVYNLRDRAKPSDTIKLLSGTIIPYKFPFDLREEIRNYSTKKYGSVPESYAIEGESRLSRQETILAVTSFMNSLNCSDNGSQYLRVLGQRRGFLDLLKLSFINGRDIISENYIINYLNEQKPESYNLLDEALNCVGGLVYNNDNKDLYKARIVLEMIKDYSLSRFSAEGYQSQAVKVRSDVLSSDLELLIEDVNVFRQKLCEICNVDAEKLKELNITKSCKY